MTMFILDTDVGYDPDDLMAIWTFVNQFPHGHIVTSAENGKMRARVVCELVKDFKDIQVYAGLKGRAGSVDGSFSGWAKTQFQCAVSKYDQIVAACLRDETTTYDDRIQPLENLYGKMQSAAGDIVWIGIGAMTNLSTYLSKYPDTQNIHVVQMGVCSKNVKKYAPTNIFLDPGAAHDVNEWFKDKKGYPKRVNSTLTYVGSDFTGKVPWLHGKDLHNAGYGTWIQGNPHAQKIGKLVTSNGVTPKIAFDTVYAEAEGERVAQAAQWASESRVDHSTPGAPAFEACREVWETTPSLKKCIIANIVSCELLGGEAFPVYGFPGIFKLYFDRDQGVEIPHCGECWPWDSNFHDILTVYIAWSIHEKKKTKESLGIQPTIIDLRSKDGALEKWTLPNDQILDEEEGLIPEAYVSFEFGKGPMPIITKDKRGADYQIPPSGDQASAVAAHLKGLFKKGSRDTSCDSLIDEMNEIRIDEDWEGTFQKFCNMHAPWKDEFKTFMCFDLALAKSNTNTFITTKKWKVDGELGKCLAWVKDVCSNKQSVAGELEAAGEAGNAALEVAGERSAARNAALEVAAKALFRALRSLGAETMAMAGEDPGRDGPSIDGTNQRLPSLKF